MFTLGLIVGLVIFVAGVAAGSLLQSKTGWPWK